MSVRIGPLAPLRKIMALDLRTLHEHPHGVELLECGHTFTPAHVDRQRPPKTRRCPACPSSLEAFLRRRRGAKPLPRARARPQQRAHGAAQEVRVSREQLTARLREGDSCAMRGDHFRAAAAYAIATEHALDVGEVGVARSAVRSARSCLERAAESVVEATRRAGA